jgi:hypothetical protein
MLRMIEGMSVEETANLLGFTTLDREESVAPFLSRAGLRGPDVIGKLGLSEVYGNFLGRPASNSNPTMTPLPPFGRRRGA